MSLGYKDGITEVDGVVVMFFRGIREVPSSILSRITENPDNFP